MMSYDAFKRQLVVLLVMLVSATLSGEAVFALDPKKAITQYIHDVWQTEDGLPKNTIFSVIQTSDGYIWLGTEDGLVRFDGVRFTVFDTGNTSELKTDVITKLFQDQEGNLWIATNGGGLNRFKNGRFTNYTTDDGLSNDFAGPLCEDREGNLWIGTGRGLNRFKDGKFTIYTTKQGLSGDILSSICEDREGNLWIGTSGGGLNRFKDGKFTAYTTDEGLSNDFVGPIYDDREGNLWIGTRRGLNRFKDGKFTIYTTKQGLSGDMVYSIYEDREGNLWIGTDGGGLNRFKNGRFISHAIIDGLYHNIVGPIYEDREGNLWVGAEGGGLHRFKDGRFTSYTTIEGLASDAVDPIYEDRGGNLWIGTAGGGLNRFKDGKFTNYTTDDGLSDNFVRAIYEDRKGNLWVGTDGGGLNRFKDGKFTNYSTNWGSHDVRAIYEDRDRNLWIGTSGGLHRFKDGIFTTYTTGEGLSHDSVRAIYEDRKGNLWIGTYGGGLNRFKNGEFTNYTTAQGLSNNIVEAIYEDGEENLWLGTGSGGGLSRFKDGKFTNYTTIKGLFDDTVYQILEDGTGNLWMSCNKGIFRVSKTELNDFAQGKIESIHSVAYGTADGMKSRECTGGGKPAGCKTRDGRLWFPTIKGLVVIDPNNMKLNTLAPPVYIEQVLISKTPVDLQQKVEVRPGQRDLEIHYTGLSFVAPEKVRFQYMLEGYDKDWVDASTRRVAYYTSISPGSYTFRVKACNNDGVWSTQDASIQITVIPPFWRTWWFLTIMVLATVLAVSGTVAVVAILVHKRRISHLQRAHAAQKEFSRQLIDSQESERKRIASELHDSLGQNLLVVKNSALLGLNMAEDGSPTEKQFDEISTMTSQALEEVREITHNLRPYHLDQLGLKEALEFMLEKIGGSSEIRFSAEIDIIDGIFSKEAEMNLYRIVQESINNIVKHSDATEAKVALKRDGRSVQLIIEDNGKGFISNPRTSAESRRRGFGLTGISERSRMLGGKEVIHSVPGKGTTISITVMLQEGRHQDGRHED